MSVASASFASTASFVQTAQTASFVQNAVSASFAQTASFLSGTVASASFASTASKGVNGFAIEGTSNVALTLSSSTSNVFSEGPVLTLRGGTGTIQTLFNEPVGGSGNMKIIAGGALFIECRDQLFFTTHAQSPAGDMYWTDPACGDFQIRANSVQRSGSLWFKPNPGTAEAGLKVEKIPTQVQFADYSQNTGDWVNFLTIAANTTANPNPPIQLKRSTVVSGSFTVITGSATELFVTNTGVQIGNVVSDTHTVTGSLNISGSSTFVGDQVISGSSTINDVLVLPFQSPLPSSKPTGSVAISGSGGTFVGMFVYNGTSWNSV